MDLIRALIYGLIQGATEWLPISSTAHLRIAPALFGWEDPGAAFTAVIQLGTTLAAIVYFRKDIAASLAAMVRDPKSPAGRIGWGAFLGTFPIILVALLAKDAVEGPLRSLWVIAGTFVVGGLFMIAADRRSGGRSLDTVSVADGVKVGLFQCLALIPGMSRSGSTIAGARFLGLDREAAARASFLLSIPATAAAGFYQLFKERKGLLEAGAAPTALATIVAFIVGYLTIEAFIGIVKKHGIAPFVLYRLVAAAVIVGLVVTGRVPAEEPVIPVRTASR